MQSAAQIHPIPGLHRVLGSSLSLDEALELREIGKLQIARASHVEPDRGGFWGADMGPVDGPFESRTEALQPERGLLAAKTGFDDTNHLKQKLPFDFRLPIPARPV